MNRVDRLWIGAFCKPTPQIVVALAVATVTWWTWRAVTR